MFEFNASLYFERIVLGRAHDGWTNLLCRIKLAIDRDELSMKAAGWGERDALKKHVEFLPLWVEAYTQNWSNPLTAKIDLENGTIEFVQKEK